MMEDLGKYVIKNITGRTYWKSCSLQEGMRHRKRHDGLFIQLSFIPALILLITGKKKISSLQSSRQCFLSTVGNSISKRKSLFH
jgi:hypothetical protein